MSEGGGSSGFGDWVGEKLGKYFGDGALRGERSLKDSTRLAVRGVDEGFGLVVAESGDSACGDAGQFGGGGFTSLGESLIVKVYLRKEDY